jgi:hypothetical protein
MLLFILLLPKHEGVRPRKPSVDEQERRGWW